jgi:hypothetical protein
VEFLRWIWAYPRKQRPEILRRLDAVRAEKRVVILGSTQAVDRFLTVARRD